MKITNNKQFKKLKAFEAMGININSKEFLAGYDYVMNYKFLFTLFTSDFYIKGF